MQDERPGSAGSAHISTGSWAGHGWAGLALIALCWPLTWLLPGMRSHALFFPLWLGYVLTVDALTAWRSGTSLFTRSRAGFALLFAASVPAWWLFELFNRRLGNWVYVGGETLSDLAYVLWASLAFSTVIPAVFATAELLRTFRRGAAGSAAPRLAVGPGLRWGLALAGAAMLALALVWPRFFYPLIWLSVAFLLDPVCHALRRPSLLGHLERGERGPLLGLALGALVCGLFWEGWNFYANPKWTYRVPFFGFAHLFEMPLAGYLGYLPFGLELYPLTHLLLPRAPDLKL